MNSKNTDDELDDAPLSRDDYRMVTGGLQSEVRLVPPGETHGGGPPLGEDQEAVPKKCGVLSRVVNPRHVFGQTRTGARNPRGKGSGLALRTVPTWNG